MSEEKSNDWDEGWIAGSEAQHEATTEHIVQPLQAENEALKAEAKMTRQETLRAVTKVFIKLGEQNE